MTEKKDECFNFTFKLPPPPSGELCVTINEIRNQWETETKEISSKCCNFEYRMEMTKEECFNGHGERGAGCAFLDTTELHKLNHHTDLFNGPYPKGWCFYPRPGQFQHS